MKNSIIITTILLGLTFTTVSAQIKYTNRNVPVKEPIINTGIKIKNLKKLSINQLAAKKIPIVSIEKKQGKGKAIKSWKITPNRPKDNLLSVKSFYGWLSSNKWSLESSPFFEGTKIASWNPGWLDLNFRQSKNIEYRMKIKLQGTNHRGKALYVNLGEMSARYPVNPDGLVHVVWSPTISVNSISIGHSLPNNYNVRDYPKGFPRTVIEYVNIVRE